MAKEVSNGHIKKAKNNNFAPFDLLQEHLATGSVWSAERFKEYANATHNTHYLTSFTDAEKYYDVDLVTDEDLIDKQTENAELVGVLTYVMWQKVLAAKNGRAIVLELAKTSWAEVLRYVMALPPVKSPKLSRSDVHFPDG